MDCIQNVYNTILDRRDNPSPNSYTRYLFDRGLDKILKKVGEEAAEIIIAAKNGENRDTIEEIADLTYHLLVLMAYQGITPGEVSDLLKQRHKKSGNLKTPHNADRNS
ncbi:MAG TPA: phosphoribosyl-ATP diphosphatase [Candidatus Avimonas sp.]|jgi:phosphoribosyl-ATP pyrophosphohydrolase|nr:phosphoribosyl-ATP diphosphatase [Clostridiales bacterium]HOB35976.1 phosphoribosyl-ATP diphosphatase [Candidatus Avimonas sp.]HQA15673.1 phosphoribosyl-ATP diphosphatase [Candidatus Avimonas sp.]HQD37412.1 phosphoribosyl-ATP diphosphatase [Candidatus Avimonas sp.]